MIIRGKKYRVTYQIPGLHRVPREAVMIPFDHNTRVIFFSGRPQFGTTEIERLHIISYEEVAPQTKCYVNRKVKP